MSTERERLDDLDAYFEALIGDAEAGEGVSIEAAVDARKILDELRAAHPEPCAECERTLIEHDEDDRAFPSYTDAMRLLRRLQIAANDAPTGPDALLYDAAQMVDILAMELRRIHSTAALPAGETGERPSGLGAAAKRGLERSTRAAARAIANRHAPAVEREHAYPFATDVPDRMPEGAVRVIGTPYLHGDELIVTGTPSDEDTWPDPETGHDCDAMGCTSVSHVVLRARVPAWQLGTPPAAPTEPPAPAPGAVEILGAWRDWTAAQAARPAAPVDAEALRARVSQRIRQLLNWASSGAGMNRPDSIYDERMDTAGLLRDVLDHLTAAPTGEGT